MANESTTTTLDDLLPKIISEAMFIAEETSLMRNLVKNYTAPLGGGTTVNVPKYARQTAAAVAEGTDLANTAVSTTEAVLTISEVGIMTTITDMAARSTASNVVADVGRLFGEAIARKQDADLCALFDGFSTVVGDGTSALTAAAIFNAVAQLRANSVVVGNVYCVIHPEIAYDLKDDLTNTFANPAGGDVQNTAMVNGYVGMLAGVPVFESANIVSTAGDSKGAVFHQDALGLAVQNDITIELQRDASLRATELVATSAYGVGELEDSYGVEVWMDSSIVS